MSLGSQINFLTLFRGTFESTQDIESTLVLFLSLLGWCILPRRLDVADRLPPQTRAEKVTPLVANLAPHSSEIQENHENQKHKPPVGHHATAGLSEANGECHLE